jgi:hypothetical protein
MEKLKSESDLHDGYVSMGGKPIALVWQQGFENLFLQSSNGFVSDTENPIERTSFFRSSEKLLFPTRKQKTDNQTIAFGPAIAPGKNSVPKKN